MRRLDWSFRQTSKPSSSGIITSSKTISHSARSQSASASTPLYAVVTSKYSADSRASSSFRLAGTSSTTRIRAVIEAPSARTEEVADRLDEFANGDRLGEIGLAAPLANTLLIALHGKRRDRHDRDGFELWIIFEPFGHFETRNFGQLDVHQNQIRPVLAGEIERFNAVAGADSLVTMGFKKVVEELHIELVVFHDQDGLWHYPFPALFVPNAREVAQAQSPPRPRSGMIGTVVPICYGKANLLDEAKPSVHTGTGRRACDSGPYVHCWGW